MIVKTRINVAWLKIFKSSSRVRREKPLAVGLA